MTCFVAFVGLLPASISNGVGSQVQKPLALVVVGGAFLAPFLILTVLPTLAEMVSRHVGRFKQPAAAAHGVPAHTDHGLPAHETEVTAE
jgi:cobalt-zinc-cadmium resistance protein CzcA